MIVHSESSMFLEKSENRPTCHLGLFCTHPFKYKHYMAILRARGVKLRVAKSQNNVLSPCFNFNFFVQLINLVFHYDVEIMIMEMVPAFLFMRDIFRGKRCKIKLFPKLVGRIAQTSFIDLIFNEILLFFVKALHLGKIF